MGRFRFPWISEDEERRFRLGRFSDADQREMEDLVRMPARRRRGGRTPVCQRKIIDRGCRSRANFLFHDESSGRSVEAIVKVASTTKSARGAAAMVRYVGRIGKDGFDDAKGHYFRDEFHDAVTANQALDHLAGWELLVDEENLSKVARENTDPRSLEERQRLRNIQAWHFVFSIAENADDDEVVDRFQSAMSCTVGEVFAGQGFRVLWIVHRDHAEHLHAHVIVKAVAWHGGRLRCDRDGDYLFGTRTVFAQNLRRVGLDYTASRREDRWQTRERILAGYEPLRVNDNSYMRRSGRDVWLVLKRQVWEELFEANEYRGLPPVKLSKASWFRSWKQGRRESLFEAEIDASPGEYQKLIRSMATIYEDPFAACSAWIHLACLGACRGGQGDPGLPYKARSLWELKHYPDQFGRLLREPDESIVESVAHAAETTNLPAFDPLQRYYGTADGSGNVEQTIVTEVPLDL